MKPGAVIRLGRPTHAALTDARRTVCGLSLLCRTINVNFAPPETMRWQLTDCLNCRSRGR